MQPGEFVSQSYFGFLFLALVELAVDDVPSQFCLGLYLVFGYLVFVVVVGVEVGIGSGIHLSGYFQSVVSCYCQLLVGCLRPVERVGVSDVSRMLTVESQVDDRGFYPDRVVE